MRHKSSDRMVPTKHKSNLTDMEATNLHSQSAKAPGFIYVLPPIILADCH